jgi:ascorbate-specific PTS system EIIC-type component UlaA
MLSGLESTNMENVDTARETDRPATGGPTDRHDPVPGVVDWLVGLVTGAVGLLLMIVGGAMFTRVDRSMITDIVTDEEFEVNGLTESEAITAAEPFVDWLAVGILLTGLLSVVAAVAFVVVRRRTRRRVVREGGTTATFWACAIYGAVVTMLVSFVPGSAIAGGGAAAYLHDGDTSVRTGAASGAIGAVLMIPLLVFLAGGLITGAEAIGRLSDGALLGAIVVGGGLLSLAVNTGLGALGGFLADRFA